MCTLGLLFHSSTEMRTLPDVTSSVVHLGTPMTEDPQGEVRVFFALSFRNNGKEPALFPPWLPYHRIGDVITVGDVRTRGGNLGLGYGCNY